jgi:beta-lactamase class A
VLARRTLLIGSLTAGFAATRPAIAGLPAEQTPSAIAQLEARHGGRLGVAILDGESGPRIVHRGNDLFPLCSTHKFLSAAFVLSRVDSGKESLTRRVKYPESALVSYSPITKQDAGGEGMTVGELCEAAMVLSDNTAGNLLLDSFGGPAGLTRFARSLGDGVTRLDRREPELNQAAPGDLRDTTSPAAMLELVRKLLLTPTLSTPAREQLAAWLVGCKTGGRRLRAGMPKDWRVGDKSGSGDNNATNDIAIAWPPGRQPILITAYYAEAQATAEEREAVLAAIGAIAATP